MRQLDSNEVISISAGFTNSQLNRATKVDLLEVRPLMVSSLAFAVFDWKIALGTFSFIWLAKYKASFNSHKNLVNL